MSRERRLVPYAGFERPTYAPRAVRQHPLQDAIKSGQHRGLTLSEIAVKCGHPVEAVRNAVLAWLAGDGRP